MEIWKPLRNFPSYNGSSEGRIINVRTQKIQTPVLDKKGYLRVCLYRNKKRYYVRVHKVLAETFLGAQVGMDVRHKDNDRTNNNVENLEWRTRSETVKAAYERGSKLPRRARDKRGIFK